MKTSKTANINNLYESKDNNLIQNMKNELNVKVAQKWGDEGYKEQKPVNAPKPFAMNINSIGSNGISNSTTNVPNNMYTNTNKIHIFQLEEVL